jgi:tetratricopeptide (TPR) repeat protein
VPRSRSRVRAALGAALLLWLGAGCTPKGEQLRAELESGTRPGRYIPLEFVPQEPNRCGSAALSEVLTYWKVPDSGEEKLAEEVFSESLKGTLNADLTAAARRRDLVLRDGASTLSELQSIVADGYPAVVMIALSPHVLGRKHFLAVKGVDTARGYLMADDGRRNDAVLRPRNFRRDWRAAKFWALYCWPPEKSPEWASPAEELDAGVILERRSLPGPAREAYLRALSKDAELWEAEFNLGNVELAAGDLAAAEKRYRRALEIKPGETDVLNNLAHVLLKAGGRPEEAEKTARAALGSAPGAGEARVRSLHTLGLVLAVAGKTEEARTMLRRAIREAEEIKRPALANAAKVDLEGLKEKD